jgi:hypothetical protein
VSVRRPVEDALARLDPLVDHEEIVRLDYTLAFPWDTARALELALFRTFAVPEIAELLVATGELERRTQRRYDATAILVGEFLAHGHSSERGRRAIRRMNQIHGRFAIDQEVYRYVLSTFVCEPPRWLARFGRRALAANECAAGHHFWARVAAMMNIRDLPESFAKMDAWNRDFERRAFRRSDAGTRLANATLELMLSWYLPRALRAWGRPAVHALMDEPLLEAFGFPRPPAMLRRTVETAMRARARALHFLPDRRQAQRVEDTTWRSYPHGYEIEDVGGSRPDDAPTRTRS